MQTIPINVAQAAKNLLDNEDLKLVLSYKLAELTDDVLESTEDKDVLAAKQEYTHIYDFGDWIATIGKAQRDDD